MERGTSGTACHLLLAVSLSSGFTIFCLQSIPLAANLASPYRPMLYAMIDGPLAPNYSTITLLYSPVTSLSLSSLLLFQGLRLRLPLSDKTSRK